jgi:hypothetical protein
MQHAQRANHDVSALIGYMQRILELVSQLAYF